MLFCANETSVFSHMVTILKSTLGHTKTGTSIYMHKLADHTIGSHLPAENIDHHSGEAVGRGQGGGE